MVGKPSTVDEAIAYVWGVPDTEIGPADKQSLAAALAEKTDAVVGRYFSAPNSQLWVGTLRKLLRPTDHQRLAGALSSSDRIRLNGKISVLKRGDLEKGDKRRLSLFKRGDDDQDLQKDGKPAGRLLLININNMVPVESAKVEVLGPNGETIETLLPEDDGNGLSEELFVYDSVIRVLPFKDAWWRRAWALIVAQGAGFLSLLVAIVALALHYKSRIAKTQT